MEKKIKQNKNTCFKFATAFFVVVIVVCLSSFSAFADSSNGIDFSGQPLSSTGTTYLTSTSGRPYIVPSSSFDFASDFYVFTTGATAVFVSTSPWTNSSYPFWIYAKGSSSGAGMKNSSYNASYSLYYSEQTISNISLDNFTIPLYLSVNSGLAAVREFIDNPPSTASVYPLSTSYLEIDSSSYVKASINDCSALALWSPDGGETLRAIVGTVNAENILYRYTDSSYSGISVVPFPSIAADFYGNTFTSVSSDYLDIGYFDSSESALTAIYNYLVESGASVVPATGHHINLSLPGGYVMIADINGVSDSALSLNGTIGTDMTLSQINDSTYVFVGQSSSPPSAPFTLPVSGTSRISSWTGDNPSVLGTYFHVRYNNVFYSANGGYVIVVNPYLTGNSEQAGTNGLDLEVSIFANNAVVYSLQGTLSYVDGEWSQEDITTNDQYTVTVDPDTGETIISDMSGQPVSDLKYGGSNSTFVDDLGSTTRNFISWLQKTLKSIGSALDVGKNAIISLVGYASGFFGVITTLYAWLPGPVYSVLSSAIVLVITIGLIKVFL